MSLGGKYAFATLMSLVLCMCILISCSSVLCVDGRGYSNKVGLDVVSLSGWFVVCVIVSVDKERNIKVS